jgi:hypothetical protein
VDVDHLARARGLLQAAARCSHLVTAGLPRACLELADAGGVVLDRAALRGHDDLHIRDHTIHLVHPREQRRPPRGQTVGKIGGVGKVRGGTCRQQ